MNVLIIATAVLTGPVASESLPVASSTITTEQVSLAAFATTPSALALGAGDSLGLELFSTEIMMSLDREASPVLARID